MKLLRAVICLLVAIMGGQSSVFAAGPKFRALQVCLRSADGKIFAKRKCKSSGETAVDASALSALSTSVQGPMGPKGPQGDKGEQGIQGNQGVPGANGFAGWQIVDQATSPTMSSGQILAFDVSCPAGKVVLGGGCLQSTSAIIITSFYPLNNSTWRCTYKNDFPNPLTPTLHQYAICAFPG